MYVPWGDELPIPSLRRGVLAAAIVGLACVAVWTVAARAEMSQLGLVAFVVPYPIGVVIARVGGTNDKRGAPTAYAVALATCATGYLSATYAVIGALLGIPLVNAAWLIHPSLVLRSIGLIEPIFWLLASSAAYQAYLRTSSGMRIRPMPAPRLADGAPATSGSTDAEPEWPNVPMWIPAARSTPPLAATKRRGIRQRG